MGKGMVGALLGAVLLAGAARGQEVEAAGASSVAPLMKKWALEYARSKKGAFSYRSVNSGGAIGLLLEGKLDFACTDAPLSKALIERARKGGRELLHLPLTFGAVVPAYNLPGVDTPVRFSGEVLADIYLGRVTRWNDPALKRLNPSVVLPNLPIAVVYRADSAGSNYVWTDYLSRVSTEAKLKFGVTSLPKWVTGKGVKGGLALRTAVTRTPGALGAVEYVYAAGNDMQFGAVQNRAGEFVRCDPKAVQAALFAMKKLPGDLRVILVDAPGKAPYPIAHATFAIVPIQQPRAKARAIRDFLEWATNDGQRFGGNYYVPLPPSVRQALAKRIEVIGTVKK